MRASRECHRSLANQSVPWRRGLHLLRRLRARTQQPGVVSFNQLLALPVPWKMALQLLGLEAPSLTSFNAALARLRIGGWRAGLGLFEGLRPDVVSVNSALALPSPWRVAVGLFHSAQLKLDVISFSSVQLALRSAAWVLGLAHWQHLAQSMSGASFRARNVAATSFSDASAWRQALGVAAPDLCGLNCALRCFSERWPSALAAVEAASSAAGLRPDVVSHGSVIAGFERAAEWRFALNFLRSRCWAPNVFCYNSASSACARAGEWPICAELVRTVSGVSWQPDLITLNSALRATSVEGHWRVAKVLLKAIRQVGFQLSPVSCGSLTSSCGRCWRRAFHWLDYTKSAGVEVGEIPRNAVISACEKAAAWQAAVEAERGGGPSLVGCNSLLSACEKGSQWQMALHLLLSLPREVIPDEITFNAVLGAVLRVALDAGAYVSVMSVCEKASQWTAALDLLSALLRAALQPEGAAYSSAISSCGKAEQWERALQLPRGDAAAAAAAVLALERGSQWQAALGLFLNMRSQERSELGYLAAFGACEKGTRWRMGPQLLSAMQQQLLRPAAVASTAAVAAVAEEWPQAVLLLAGMRRRAVCDASPAFNAALGGLAGLTEWQLALAMLWRKQQLSLPMKGMNFGAAVSAANGARQWRQGAKLLASAWEVWGGLSAEDATESGGVWEGVEILAKGPGLVAINKPSGVSTEAVLAKLPVAAVSRLDKPTSGVLVAALGSDCSPAFQLASAQFSARSVVKEYLCLCHGSLGAPGAQGRTARPLLRDWASGRMAGDGGGGAAAATAFEVLEVFGGPGALTLLKVTPETGRRHQIRVHLASLGRPIVSDPLYGSEDPWCPQLFLHCRRTVLLDAAGGA
ncbi:unnamed protein product, partial [Effrenium voratum]